MKNGVKVVWWASALAALGLGSVALWPVSTEKLHIDALESGDFAEIKAAAGFLAASGVAEALGPLRSAQTRLVEKLVQDEKWDLKQFSHLDFDSMVRRISDRRQSPQAQRFWGALGAVNQAIWVLDPSAPAGAPLEPLASEDPGADANAE